jgi:hypothetical protein
MDREARIKVTEVSCDGCGYIDSPEKFPDIWNSPKEYREVMEKFGNGEYLTNGVGTVCPKCGNFCEFDFDPDNKRGKGLLEIVYEEV